MLLLAGFIGAICAGPIAPHLLHHFKPARTVPIILLFQAIFVAIAAMTNQFWSYITIAFALGCTSSLFWSSILVTVPDFANNDHQLDRINRIIQTVRNLGYIVGPLLGVYYMVYQTGKRALCTLNHGSLCSLDHHMLF